MDAKTLKAPIILSLIICPLLSVPLIFKELRNGRLYALNYLTFFMALLAYLWIPSGDVYRFYLEYDTIKTLSFNEVWDFADFDCLSQYAMYFFSKTGLNFEWFRFITCIVEYSLVFSVLKDCIARNNYGSDNKTIFRLIIITFGLLRFSVFLTGARFTMSLVLMVYCINAVFYNNNKRGLLLFLLAPMCHYSFWPVYALMVLCKLLNPQFERKIVITLCIVFLSVSAVLLIVLIDYMRFGDAMMNRLENYTTGYYAEGELENQSFFFMLAQIFSILAFYAFSALAFWKMKSFKHCQLYVCLFLFCILLINMNTAFNRYASLAAFSFLPYFLMNIDGYFTKKHLKYVSYLAIFVFATSVYTTKRELRMGDQIDIVKPLPVIVFHSYSDAWINKHIQSNGNMVGND